MAAGGVALAVSNENSERWTLALLKLWAGVLGSATGLSQAASVRSK